MTPLYIWKVISLPPQDRLYVFKCYPELSVEVIENASELCDKDGVSYLSVVLHKKTTMEAMESCE